MKKTTDQYLLICFGDYSKNYEKMIKEIANVMMPLVSSENVKYYNNNLNIIYYFKSQVKFSDLQTYVNDYVSPFVGMYFLINCNDSISMGMPNDLYEYLFDLTNTTKLPDSKKVLDTFDEELHKEILDDIMAEFKEQDDMFEDDDNELARIMTVKGKNDVPSLDELLDKIGSQGIGSLTKKEREVLETYSNK